MADYRNDGDHTTVRRGGAGRTIAIILAILGIIAAILFATGFWSADVKEGALPDVDVSAKGGALPGVDVDSKSVVVGTKSTTVDVPKVTTEKETVDVPVIGVSEGEADKK
jgi:pseudouridine-5'-phosphate glycosidase